MQKYSKILAGIVALIAIVGIGILLGNLGGSGKPAPNAQPSQVESSSNKSQTSAAPIAPVTAIVPKTNSIRPAHPSATVVSLPLTNWEERLDEIIGAETDDTNKVNQLFDLFPRAPEDAKPEIVQHLSNLVSDEEYSRLGELLKDPTLPDSALDILMSDALNRPNGIKLPELLDVAKTSGHPKADEAKDILALFLDEDYGQDWPKWQDKMTAWLKDNPD